MVQRVRFADGPKFPSYFDSVKFENQPENSLGIIRIRACHSSEVDCDFFHWKMQTCQYEFYMVLFTRHNTGEESKQSEGGVTIKSGNKNNNDKKKDKEDSNGDDFTKNIGRRESENEYKIKNNQT